MPRTLEDHIDDARRWSECLDQREDPMQLTGWRPTIAVLVAELDRIRHGSAHPTQVPDAWALDTAAMQVLQCPGLHVASADVITLTQVGEMNDADKSAVAYLVREWEIPFKGRA